MKQTLPYHFTKQNLIKTFYDDMLFNPIEVIHIKDSTGADTIYNWAKSCCSLDEGSKLYYKQDGYDKVETLKLIEGLLKSEIKSVREVEDCLCLYNYLKFKRRRINIELM